MSLITFCVLFAKTFAIILYKTVQQDIGLNILIESTLAALEIKVIFVQLIALQKIP